MSDSKHAAFQCYENVLVITKLKYLILCLIVLGESLFRATRLLNSRDILRRLLIKVSVEVLPPAYFKAPETFGQEINNLVKSTFHFHLFRVCVI